METTFCDSGSSNPDLSRFHSYAYQPQCKFKFAGRQKLVVSNKWGFTKWMRDDFQRMMEEGSLEVAGNIAKYVPNHGPLPDGPGTRNPDYRR